MNVSSIPRMRAEVTKQLLNYRRNKARVNKRSVGRPIGGTLRGWVHTIDAARAYIRKRDPQKERFLCRLYGLESPIPQRISSQQRLLRIRQDFAVAESTLYKWREEVLQIVLYAAIEAGLMQPFGAAGRKIDAADTE